MEFWLSMSLSHELFFFHDGILAIKKPFTRTFFFFHDGILAIKKPFTRTFFLFHDGILSIKSLFTNFLSHDGISAITEPFPDFFFHMMEFLKKMHDMGEDSFHIYHKDYLHRIRLVKNLAS
jgi:hypothetical protein